MRLPIRLMVPVAIAGGLCAIFGLGRHGPGPVATATTASRPRERPPVIASSVWTDETATPAPAAEPAPSDPSPDVLLRTEYFAALQAQHAAEPPDPSWSPTAEQQLRAIGTGARERSAPLVTSVACRQTLCRVELGHPNEAETATDQERFLGRIAGAFPEAALETEGDRTVVFISRPGHLLPEPSRPVASASEDEEAATEVE